MAVLAGGQSVPVSCSVRVPIVEIGTRLFFEACFGCREQGGQSRSPRHHPCWPCPSATLVMRPSSRSSARPPLRKSSLRSALSQAGRQERGKNLSATTTSACAQAAASLRSSIGSRLRAIMRVQVRPPRSIPITQNDREHRAPGHSARGIGSAVTLASSSRLSRL